MKNTRSYLITIRLLVILIFAVTGIATKVSAQQSYAATPTITVTQKSCYNDASFINYSYNVINTTNPPSGGAYVCGTDYTVNLTATRIELRRGTSITGTLIATGSSTKGCVSNYGGMNVIGSFNLTSQIPDVYTVWAFIYVDDIRAGRSVVLPTYSNTVVIGREAVWTDLSEMTGSPNNFSLKRTTNNIGQTYGGGRSLNLLASGSDGFIYGGAQFGSTVTNGSVYLVFSKTTATTNFNPSASGVSYVEYRKTGASTAAVYVRNGITNTTSAAISGMNAASYVRIVKVGTTVSIYNGTGTTAVATITGFNQPMSVGVFASNINDGAKDVVTSFNCSYEHQFYLLKDESDESYAYINDSELRFKFEEDYFDQSGLLTYKIINLTTDLVTNGSITKPSHANWIKLNLGASPGIGLTAGGTMYLLQVTDVNGNKKYLKFKYQS